MRPARLLRRALGLVLLAALLVVGGTAVRVWAVARTDARPASDAVVVLGASQYDGTPSAIFAARLRHAAALYRAGVAPRVVTVGGGREGDRFTEAEAGATYLADRGLPRSALVEVRSGGDTLTSLQAADALFAQRGWRSAVVVTDPWHALRARQMARDLGLAAESSPARTGPAVRTRETQARYIARETAAYLYYRAAGRSPDTGPGAA